MPRVATIESQRQLPASTGEGFLDARPFAAVGEAVKDLGLTAMDVALAHEEKTEKVKIADVTRRLRTESQERFLETQGNLQGKAALPDEKAGTPGVYKEYQDWSATRIGELSAEISPKYRDVAVQSLNGVGDQYGSTFARYQAQQLGVYRQNTIKALSEQRASELNMIMASDVAAGALNSAGAIVSTVQSMGFDFEDNAGGQDTTALEIAYANQTTKSAIVAKMEVAPSVALEMIDDDRLQPYLTPEDKSSLTKQAEAKRLEKETDALVGMVSGQPYTVQKDIISGYREDSGEDYLKQVRAQAHSTIDTIESNRKRQETAEQFTSMSDLHTRIFVDKEAITTTDVDRMDSINFQQKQVVKGWIGSLAANEKPGQLDPFNRLIKWDDARSKIFSQQWDADDVRKAALAGDIDIRDGKSLIEFAERFQYDPSIYNVIDEYFKKEYNSTYNNDKKRAEVMFGTMEDILEHMREQGDNARPPDRTTIHKFITDNARGVVESHLLTPDPEGVDIAQEQFSNIDVPLRSVDPAEKPTQLQRDTARRLARGYTQAEAVSGINNGVIYLGAAPGRPGFVLVDFRDGKDEPREVPEKDWFDSLAEISRGR